MTDVAEIQVVIAIIVNEGTVLITRRHDNGRHLAGFWEFPGGKVDSGESLETALHREVAEELDIRVKVRLRLRPIVHQYPGKTVSLYPFICDHEAGDAKPLAAQALQWVPPAALNDYQFPSANASLLSSLPDLLSGARSASKLTVSDSSDYSPGSSPD